MSNISRFQKEVNAMLLGDEKWSLGVFILKVLALIAAASFAIFMVLSIPIFSAEKRERQQAYRDGADAQRAGASDAANPMLRYPDKATAWLQGYLDAKNGKAEKE